MIQFKKLRLHGFKSFVDRTDLEIAPGLNGIVGPNGCGKSNLVEALRWVMGESSAKRMRGDGMEDVIFSGTSKRSARNIAEVSLLLDNSAHAAPPAYNQNEEIEVTRKIERDRGSLYKINGKTVRARDVNMLFADTVTGANSPALVSQGRVAQIINAKPLNRRQILEESAGISGLYARRHEAELRLKAADRNLERIEDILTSMQGRLGALKRQAKQATRYRNLGAQIRQYEILIAWLEYRALEERRKNTQDTFAAAESQVAEKLVAVTQLTKTHNTQMQDLPPLRTKDTETAAALQTQRLALQRIEDDAQRLKQALEETAGQIEQSQNDLSHEKAALEDNTQNLEKLQDEQKTLLEKQENDSHILDKRQKARDDLEARVLNLEERHNALMKSAAETQARREALQTQISQNKDRVATLTARKTKADDELKALQDSDQNTDKIESLDKTIQKDEEALSVCLQDIERIKTQIQERRQDINQAREALKKAETAQSALHTEINMLQQFLSQAESDDFKPVLDLVTPESGFEKALSRALGDSLLASLDQDAPCYWRIDHDLNKTSLPALPDGAISLIDHVKAPPELALALSQIGYVEKDERGHALAANLRPGQALVSKHGTYWRWDGFFMKAEASDRNAEHLEQKNKLKALKKEHPQHEKSVKKASGALDKLIAQNDQAELDLKALEQKRQDLNESLRTARSALAELRENNARYDSEVARLKDLLSTTTDDIKTLQEVLRWDEERLKAHEDNAAGQKTDDLETLKSTLSEARSAYQDAVRAFDLHNQEQNSRKARLHAIADERVNLNNRIIRSKERLKQLEARQVDLDAKHKALTAQPQDFETQKEKLLSRISELENERSQAAENLAVCEQAVEETAKALKEAEHSLSDAREKRAHAQATLSGIQEQHTAIVDNITQSFELSPEDLPKHASINMDRDIAELQSLKTEKENLLRKRDNIGPVNLRADEEARALEAEVTGILHERNDLVSAIDELRSGIKTINKEARERLLSAFDHVNQHFQHLFGRLFRGGKAHLALTDSDDPLDAGLEIFAQPPGKTLQSLSLLSGGEQALTAIALIFGMFLTNPSPVCVLDEIDAPLDDANVERVCDLLDEIAARGETRFIIITHHRLTMARMDRLYGVTMSEKGVSQLVSVDLQQSFAFLEAA